MAEFKFPTEEVELPSKGLLYSTDHVLSSGKVEVKYMTAKEEDILSNQSYITKGVVLDKLLESVIIDKKIKINDLVVGDKNAILIATRILGYGKEYQITYNGKKENIDLTQLENNPFEHATPGVNEFSYTLPTTNTEITYKILNGSDERKIERELEGLKKINPNNSPTLTTRLKYIITSVGGDNESKTIREFVDNQLLARDSRAFRDHIKKTQPDVNLTVSTDSGEEVSVPIGLDFFWPDFGE
jgi:hypothetical protein